MREVVDAVDGAGYPGDAERDEKEEGDFGVAPGGGVGFEGCTVAFIGGSRVLGCAVRGLERGARWGGVNRRGVLFVTVGRRGGLKVRIVNTGTSSIETIWRWVEHMEPCVLARDADFRGLGARKRFFD